MSNQHKSKLTVYHGDEWNSKFLETTLTRSTVYSKSLDIVFLSSTSAVAAIHPSVCLSVTLSVGSNTMQNGKKNHYH